MAQEDCPRNGAGLRPEPCKGVLNVAQASGLGGKYEPCIRAEGAVQSAEHQDVDMPLQGTNHHFTKYPGRVPWATMDLPRWGEERHATHIHGATAFEAVASPHSRPFHFPDTQPTTQSPGLPFTQTATIRAACPVLFAFLSRDMRSSTVC